MTMRRVKNYQTGEKVWTKPMKLPRTVRGQLSFLNDLQTRMMLDFTDKDHAIHNSEYGWGRDAKGIDKHQVASWLQSCMEKQARNKKTGTRASWRNLWLMDSPVYMWFMGRKAWWGTCLDCGRGTEGKFLRRREMYSMMAARKPGKWLTAPGTCLECAGVA
tara:strand:+ start:115 stop:597 length:483 start_codon:yes stop_codon:yes gene_type:complete